jgi:large conductance mechanosensitive channel
VSQINPPIYPFTSIQRKEIEVLKEFKEFAIRGNVIDLAIGVIIGSSFGAIVSSLVNDVVMPPIGLLLGKVNFTNLFIDLSGKGFPSMAAAKAAGTATINYGTFINTLINFVIVAFVIFLLVRAINKLKRLPQVKPASPNTKECPYCILAIPIKATRCPNCTSDLE